ncbi:ABC transporter substrate-binding protein [Desmospora activa]|uniref:L-arabinose-binding protein n=1 Tax=Desmospora activa DSM 45169 TaxID=1121389 RepID=A0A2T4Z7U1_9BACL|nr:sugar ABC transporter substrate-binding protein [Desmospora activa]PTM57951.1 L-arabinose-binding protein [Desmospora activa DSM 45169]
MAKWIALVAIIALVIAVSFTGPDSGGADGDNHLTLWTFVEQHAEYYNEMAERWNQMYPDRPIVLQVETVPDLSNKLQLSLYTGVAAPDIADIEVNSFPNFLRGEPQLIPLNDIVEPVKEHFVESRFDIYSKDGTYYGAPFHVGATVMYYNKEILDQAQVNPDDIKTWDDFVEAGKQVKQDTGKPMITVDTSDFMLFQPLVIQQGSDFLDENGEVTLDGPVNLQTLQFMHDLIYKHEIAVPTPGGQHHAEEYYGFMNQGGAAAIQMPLWYMGRFTDFMPDLKGKMIVRPMPIMKEGDAKSVGMGGTGTVVTNQAKNPELAKDFLSFAKLSKEANIEIWKQLGFDPPRSEVWNEPAFQQENKYTEYFGNDLYDTLISIKDDIRSPHFGSLSPRIYTAVNSQLQFNVLRRNSQAPEEALNKAAEEMRSLNR